MNRSNLLLNSRRLSLLLSALLLFWPTSMRADGVIPLNLADMCQRAGKIFRGTVVAAIPGSIKAGGGEIPLVTYRVRVDESFKGEFQEVKGIRFAEIRMLDGSRRAGQLRMPTSFRGLPQLEIGQTYLLLTTEPSKIGMSTTVGLGQGLFHIAGEGQMETAMNEFGNKMLFKGMESQQPSISKQRNSRLQRDGPVNYSQLADQIRSLVNEKGRKR
jgi:hypothetical protein